MTRSAREKYGFSDEEAEAILAEERHKIQTIWRALDLDGDGVLSAEEIDKASESLLTLDTNGDGQLTADEVGGPTRVSGGIRNSAIVRVLDADGDLVITADDIADAPNRLRRLDLDGDGQLLPSDDVFSWPPGRVAYFDGPAGLLWYLDFASTYLEHDNGQVLPGADDRQSDDYLLIYECNNSRDVQVKKDCWLQAPDGTRVHEWPHYHHASETISAYLRDDGLLFRTGCPVDWIETRGFPVGVHGMISLVEPDGTVVWEHQIFEPWQRTMHHDFEPLPNGNVLVTVFEGMSYDEGYEFGWVDQSRETLLKPPHFQKLWFERIIELQPNLDDGTTEIVWEWDTRDHMVQDVDPAKPNFGEIGPGCRKLDLNRTIYKDFFFCMGQLQIMLSSALHEELWIIDHSRSTEETRGEAGDLLYRWGNPASHKAGPESDKTLFWQHDIHWIPDDVPHEGDVMVFNNGARRDADGQTDFDEKIMSYGASQSDILELKMPVDDDGNWTWDHDDKHNGAKVVWSYNSDQDKDWYSPFMSGARRRTNGNTVAGLGRNKAIREVTPDGEAVLDYVPGGPGRFFRIMTYSADHPGVKKLLGG